MNEQLPGGFTNDLKGSSAVLSLFLLPLLLTFVLFAASSLRAAPDVHVAPEGSDEHPGTRERPLATLEGARRAVRERIAGGLEEDLHVRIHGGRYRLRRPVTFGPGDSGTERHAVVYSAAPDETPVFSGGREIDGWNVRDDGTWTTTLPSFVQGQKSFRQLFVDGERRPRARHPDEGYLRVRKIGPDARTRFRFGKGELPRDAMGPDLELVFLHDWSTSRVPVASIDHSDRWLETADNVGPKASHYRMDHFEKHPRYYLENDPDLLDAPGEWYLNTENGRLTYHPLAGETPDGVRVVAPVTSSLLRVEGTPERPVRNLHFRGLHFEYSSWSLPEGGYAAGQACFYEKRRGEGEERTVTGRHMVPPAIHFSLAERCRFVNGRISHLGGGGIQFGSRSHRNVLEGNEISDLSGNGVMIGEARSRRIDGDRWWKVAPGQAATGNRVTNNLIERPGRQFFGAVAVWNGFTRKTRIAHNEIRFAPYTGVSAGWMWNTKPTPCRENVVEWNHIHHVMRILSDGGGIYTLGRQPESALRGNHIHSISKNAGRAESNGMFLDQGTTGFVIEKNVIHDVYRSPLRFHRAEENLVRENVLVVRNGTVPRIRYNATDPKHIKQRNNNVVLEEDWDPADAKDRIERAGLESPHRGRLLERD